MIEDALGAVLAWIILGIILIWALFFIGIFILPPVLVGLGGFYYFRNIHQPKAAADEASRRTNALNAQAEAIAPNNDKFLQRLEQAGFVEGSPEMEAAIELYIDEGLAPPSAPPVLADTIEAARHRDKVLKYIETSQSDHYTQFERSIIKNIAPPSLPTNGGIFYGRGRRTPQQIEDLVSSFYGNEDMFKELRKTVDRNYTEQKEVMPSMYKGDNCAFDYLKDTPLLQLEYVDQKAGLTNRTSHTMILGGSGSGKTNLIEYIIAKDLESNRDGDDECTIVVIDSQVQMIPKLANLELPIDEVTYMNPKWDLGLNLFDVGYEELKASGEAETAINKAVGLIRFVLEGTLTSPMTDRQRTMFDYAIQLIISIKGGNILTFIDLLEEGGHLKHARDIIKFDKTTQSFFVRDWNSNDYKVTRNAIRARLLTLLKNPTFRRLFSSRENNFKVYDELQTRQLILLDTNKPMLDIEASSFLGRLYIAMIVQAAHRRFDNVGRQYRPVYVFIDEAQEYFDDRISEMLEQARKANIGLILAHQTISQIRKQGLDPATVIGNTATKLVSTSYEDDARTIGKSMRVKATEILDLPQYSFGLHHRNTGFIPVRAPENGLAAFEFRTDKDALKKEVELRYQQSEGTSSIEPDLPPTENVNLGDEPTPVSNKEEIFRDSNPEEKHPSPAREMDKVTRPPQSPPDDNDLDDVQPI